MEHLYKDIRLNTKLNSGDIRRTIRLEEDGTFVFQHAQDATLYMELNKAWKDGSLPDPNKERFGVDGQTTVIPTATVYEVCDHFDPVRGRARFFGDGVKGIDKDFKNYVMNYIFESGHYDRLLGK